jgi:hypothetical protein
MPRNTPNKPHVIHLDSYRQKNIMERIVAALAYVVFMYLAATMGGLELFTFLILFVLVWVITQNRALQVPGYIKYHTAHAFALGMMGEAIRMLLFGVFEVLLQLFVLLEALQILRVLNKGFQLAAEYWVYLVLVVAVYHGVCCLLGKRQSWPLAGDIARRLSSNS